MHFPVILHVTNTTSWNKLLLTLLHMVFFSHKSTSFPQVQSNPLTSSFAPTHRQPLNHLFHHAFIHSFDRDLMSSHQTSETVLDSRVMSPCPHPQVVQFSGEADRACAPAEREQRECVLRSESTRLSSALGLRHRGGRPGRGGRETFKAKEDH